MAGTLARSSETGSSIVPLSAQRLDRLSLLLIALEAARRIAQRRQFGAMSPPSLIDRKNKENR